MMGGLFINWFGGGMMMGFFINWFGVDDDGRFFFINWVGRGGVMIRLFLLIGLGQVFNFNS